MDFKSKYIKYKKKYYNIKYSKLSLKNIIDKYEKSSFVTLNKEDYIKFKNNASTYGRLTHNGLKTIMDKIKELEPSIDFKKLNFLDMGSGDGYVTAITSFYFNKSHGVELSKSRHDKAIELYNNISNTSFTNDDMLNYNLDNIDIIYISSCCFPQEILKKLGEKIKNDKHNVKYIATTKEIYLDNIKHKIQVEQSWSNGSNIYLYVL